MEHPRLGTMVRHPWIVALLAGAATGLLILGGGGRIAMYLLARQSGQSPSWTLGGTVTVLFMGIVSGVGGAAIRAAAATWLPRRSPTWVGTAIFAIACLVLTLRGLHPVDATRLGFFLPVTAIYVLAFEIMWRRRLLGATESADPRPAAVGV